MNNLVKAKITEELYHLNREMKTPYKDYLFVLVSFDKDATKRRLDRLNNFIYVPYKCIESGENRLHQQGEEFFLLEM